mmetsp:Transcript_3453/g.8595  ORF Transcript_3453/g.8595 Transcript_3453/m.8595 type:complete len:486 (-) Transcript_3453:47-1504(-)
MAQMQGLPEGETAQRRHERLHRFRETTVDAQVAVPKFCQEVPEKPIVGRSGKLFRPYERLGAGPEVVRPEAILSASLSALLDPDAQPPGGWQAIREQFWSIRQDLQMQHLHGSSLALRVALEGARLSVANGDIAEMHRCLAPLVSRGHCVQLLKVGPAEEEDEVAALRLLLLAHGGADAEPGDLQAELSEFMQENRHLMQLQPGAKPRAGPGMEYAQKVRSALSSARWTQYWRLTLNAGEKGNHPSSQRDQSVDGVPESVRQLARLLSGPVRRHALVGIAKAFCPNGMSTSRCATLLGFGDVKELTPWLKEELQVNKLGPIGRPLDGADGRLDCSAVCEYIKKADESKKAMLEERNMGGGKPLLGLSSVNTRSTTPGEAPIWSELQPQLLPFLARDAALKKMEEKKARKTLAKKLKKAKKQAKKQAKKEKKEAKKAKKAKKKEEKKAEKMQSGQVKRKVRENDDEAGPVGPHVTVSSSSSSSSSS